MKLLSKKVVAAITAAVLLTGETCFAKDYEDATSRIAADVLVYRPAGLILTAGGSVLFVLSLPVTLISGGTKRTGNTLVKTPFDMTFKRPIGTSMDYFENKEPGEYEPLSSPQPNDPMEMSAVPAGDHK